MLLSIYDSDGSPLDGYTSHITRSLAGYWDGDIEQEDLRHIMFIFDDSKIPGNLILKGGVTDMWGSDIIIKNYPRDILFLKPYFSGMSTFDTPIEIIVR